jgi:hypothetical protein
VTGGGSIGPAPGLAGCYPSDSSFVLIDPVTIRRVDDAGRLIDVIVSKRTDGAGKLAPGNAFAQSGWRQWTKYLYGASPSLAAERVYHST